MLEVIIRLVFAMTRKVMQGRHKVDIFDRSELQF